MSMRNESALPGGRMNKTGIPILALVFLAACGGDSPAGLSFRGNTSRTVTVPAGTEFSVTLQTIGPGEYSSPPTISSSSVQFRDVAQTEFAVPAGPTQRFRFFATGAGDAVIRFTHTDSNPAVEDTVQVR
jgi:hypothetical protein